jgi:hypothetical protein
LSEPPGDCMQGVDSMQSRRESATSLQEEGIGGLGGGGVKFSEGGTGARGRREERRGERRQDVKREGAG